MHLQINITGVLQFSYQKLQIQTEKHLKPLRTNKKIKNKLATEVVPCSKRKFRIIVGWFLVGITQIVAIYYNILEHAHSPQQK